MQIIIMKYSSASTQGLPSLKSSKPFAELFLFIFTVFHLVLFISFPDQLILWCASVFKNKQCVKSTKKVCLPSKIQSKLWWMNGSSSCKILRSYTIKYWNAQKLSLTPMCGPTINVALKPSSSSENITSLFIYWSNVIVSGYKIILSVSLVAKSWRDTYRIKMPPLW